ncbi:hypothetical protein CQW23_09623 [Capsicum baccatum]|uniref:Uncharacterized protein n=1 Tax=Capsicum baccatum TaxID=33114 RepID=A0A2G2WX86_CAPBA|nr:hypothetical protein CQW23_09623 [Capsicum baccatum]
MHVLRSSQGLSQQVSLLFLRIHIDSLNHSFFNPISNKMAINFDVLCSFMEYGILCNPNDRFAITEDCNRLVNVNIQLLNNPCNHVNSAIAAARLLYSTSAELRETVCCFFDFQEIKDSPNFTAKPVTDFLVFGYAAQSESHQHLPNVISWVAA